MVKFAKKVAFTSGMLIFAGQLLAAPSEAVSVKCQGISATIVSSAAVITGTSSRDVIVVRGYGTHTINSGAGNDLICGSPGADTINSGAGGDTVFGNGGNDIISAGSGNDKVFGVSGNDIITGGAGNDVVDGGNGADQLFGSAGEDRLVGGAGNDASQGGVGVDNLLVGAGTNICAEDIADVVVGTCTSDSQAPVMTSPLMNPEVSAGSLLRFDYTIEDSVGIQNTWFKIGGPSGWVTEWCGFVNEGIRISGTPQIGTYSAQCEVPITAVAQEYTLFIDSSDLFGSPQSSQIPFTVVGDVTDSSAPTISDVVVEALSVSVGETFVVSYVGTDESGVEGITAWLALNGYSFADNTGRGYAELNTYSALVSGDAKSGTYEQEFRFNAYAPVGTYTVWISVRDMYGNRNFLQTQTTVDVTG